MNSKTWDTIKAEANQAKSLNELFGLWRQAHIVEENYEETTVCTEVVKKGKIYPGIEKDSFVADGYVCSENYRGVLFILKEANILCHRGGETPCERNQRAFYENYTYNTPKQLEKMGRMACYILNKNEKPNIDEIKAGLKKIAFMNLNKRGGDNHDIKVKAYTKKYADFIGKQISLLNPTVIVCLGTFRLVYDCGLNKINSKPIPIIDMWHTAYRMPRVKRNQECEIDKNVDAYMRKFISLYAK